MGTIKELKVLVDALRRDIDSFQNIPVTVPSLQKEISALKVSHETELREVKADYESKIKNLETKLNAVIAATSKTTINCVSGFFEKLDNKISEAMIKIDIAEVESAKNEVSINNITHKLKTEPRGPVINSPAAVSDANVTRPTIGAKAPTVATLEARIDKLEDHSRRDNIIFYGFNESRDELNLT